ncbi:hypothetical protein UFOVP536_53 [uncultured Caudovirales phage]|uniref:Uncharacterized protein n=1 Tax=uncultured Caudovirales phage TaxID=2100421 RepID=A0A6J5MW96_9CAUD|nr:hypothetical protein UFOVP536_53 [uncultured Caudovirales phage]
MTHLTPHAKQALDVLAMKHIAYITALEVTREELRQELETRVSGFRLERDIALRIADEAGVPRTKLGKTIGTTNYKTVQDILALTEDAVHVEQDPEALSNSRWIVYAVGEGLFNLSINNMGIGSLTGSATVRVDGDDLVFVSGDEFVIPQIYRNGVHDAVMQHISTNLG